MHLVSVNIGAARDMPNAKKSGKSGIYKQPTAMPLHVGPDGLDGDVICDTKSHGGPDQAVYVYGMVDYAWWSAALGRELAPGTFGENLTIAGLASAGFNIGDRLQIGAVTLEVSAPRIPCVTLATRMGDPAFGKRFRDAERPGLYCRVLQPGTVQAGDEVSVVPYTGQTTSVLELFRDSFSEQLDEAAIRRHLAAPIAVRARQDMEEQLGRLRAAA